MLNTTEEKEKFYDTHIAPVLVTLGQKCQDNGFSLVALAEWDYGETGVTITLNMPSPLVRWTNYAATCKGNIDSLLFALIREARTHGHSSVIMRQLGIPEKPVSV